jgi:DNA-binding LacI/PurR family transcriptional regulator
MAYLENQFYPGVLERLGRRLRLLDYHMLLFTGFDGRESDPVFDQIMQYRVDGIILASAGLSSELAEECAAAGIPVVLFNRTTERAAVSSVTTDNAAGGRRIADFLVAGGHRRFGYVAGVADSSTNRDRHAGFAAGLAAHGIAAPRVGVGNYTTREAATAARDLVGRADRPDAIFVANDHMAVAVIDTIRHQFGLNVPQDVSVVGYDNAEPAGWAAYSITTVAQSAEAMVEATLDILMRQIDSGTIEPTQRILPGELIVRDSARRPARGLIERDGVTLYLPEASRQ